MLARARRQKSLKVLERQDSLARAKTMQQASLEEYVVHAKYTYLNTRPELWRQLQTMTLEQRARVYRELDLRRTSASTTKAASIGRFLTRIQQYGPIHPLLHWQRHSNFLAFMRVHDSPVVFSSK